MLENARITDFEHCSKSPNNFILYCQTESAQGNIGIYSLYFTLYLSFEYLAISVLKILVILHLKLEIGKNRE